MIGALRVASEETRAKLTELMAVQELQGWDRHAVFLQGVGHLRRLASDLFNHLGDAEVRIAGCAFSNLSNPRR
jgi:hypothetical protein